MSRKTDIALVDTDTREITRFDPRKALAKDLLADAGIEYASRVRNPEMIERAIEQKLDNIRELLGWWKANVQRAGQPRKNSSGTARIPSARAQEITKFKEPQISKFGRWMKREMEYRAAILAAAMKKAIAADDKYRGEGTGENEWYTPERYVEAARLAMGSIDLDPASCAEAQAVIKAGAFYTRQDDGLKREWHGNIWINPPFSRDLIATFTGKLASEYAAGRTKQAILLTHNNTDTEWFHEAVSTASAI
jgi:hypothetical protein